MLAAVAVGAPAASAAPVTAAALAPVPAGSYNGYSSGDVTYANLGDLPGVNIAKASTGQSAAGVASPTGKLTTQDQLLQPLLTKPTAGKTAYGHGTGLNVGIGGGTVSTRPQVAESTAESDVAAAEHPDQDRCAHQGRSAVDRQPSHEHR